MRYAQFKPGDKVVVKVAHPGLGIKRKGKRGIVKSVDPGICGAVGVTFIGDPFRFRELVFMPYELKRDRG